MRRPSLRPWAIAWLRFVLAAAVSTGAGAALADALAIDPEQGPVALAVAADGRAWVARGAVVRAFALDAKGVQIGRAHV